MPFILKKPNQNYAATCVGLLNDDDEAPPPTRTCKSGVTTLLLELHAPMLRPEHASP